MRTVKVPDHPGVCPWAAMERAVLSRAAVLLPPPLVLDLLADHARLAEKANVVVRRGWAGDDEVVSEHE